MPDLDAYLKYLNKGQTEMVLETAAADVDLPDGDYAKLHKEFVKGLPRGRAQGKTRAMKMAERDFAASQRPGHS